VAFESAAKRINPKITEEYLLTQPDVVDASVWFDQGELKAHVTLLDTATTSAKELRILCACELGLQHTPSHFVCLAARPKAA
jgi:hypothetical protein